MAYTSEIFGTLKALAEAVRNATEVGENTAQRVGDSFLYIVEMFEKVEIIETLEDGFCLVDESMNVGLRLDESGLDVAALTAHFKSLVGSSGGGGGVSLGDMLSELNYQDPLPSEDTYLHYGGGKYTWKKQEGGSGGGTELGTLLTEINEQNPQPTGNTFLWYDEEEGFKWADGLTFSDVEEIE